MLVIISEQESNGCGYGYADGTDNEVAMIEDYQIDFILSCEVKLTRK